MQANVKTKNGKELKVKALVDSGYIHTEIDEQLIKNKRIQTKLINFSFKVFNTDETKNGEVTNRDQHTQGNIRSSSNRLEWNKHVLKT